MPIPFRSTSARFLFPVAAVLAFGAPACREKEKEKVETGKLRSSHERPVAAAAAAPEAPMAETTPVRDPLRKRTMEEIWLETYVVPKGKHFSWERVRGMEVAEMVELIAKLPVQERRDGAREMVFLFPADEWEKMLAFAAALPIGEVFSSGMGAVGTKLATLHPQLWMTHQALLQERMTEYPYTAAAFKFGQRFGERDGVLENFEREMSAPGMTPMARTMFVSGMFGEVKDPALAQALLPKLTDNERVDTLQFRPELFKTTVFPGDAALAMMDGLTPELQGHLAEAFGNIFSQTGPEAQQPGVNEMVAKLPADQQKRFYLAYYKNLAKEDLNKTLDLIPSIPAQGMRDEVVAGMLPKIKEYDRAMAAKWAESIVDAKVKKRAMNALK